MDIGLSTQGNIQIEVTKETPNISVRTSRGVDIDLSSQTINVTPKKSNGPAFEFVQRVVAGASVVRCTLDEFQALTHLDGKTWYAVTTTSDELRYLYLGATLIAQASDDGGTWGFAYTFPMIFGR